MMGGGSENPNQNLLQLTDMLVGTTPTGVSGFQLKPGQFTGALQTAGQTAANLVSGAAKPYAAYGAAQKQAADVYQTSKAALPGYSTTFDPITGLAISRSQAAAKAAGETGARQIASSLQTAGGGNEALSAVLQAQARRAGAAGMPSAYGTAMEQQRAADIAKQQTELQRRAGMLAATQPQQQLIQANIAQGQQQLGAAGAQQNLLQTMLGAGALTHGQQIQTEGTQAQTEMPGSAQEQALETAGYGGGTGAPPPVTPPVGTGQGSWQGPGGHRRSEGFVPPSTGLATTLAGAPKKKGKAKFMY